MVIKDTYVEKHEAQPMQACLQLVACRWVKCQLNEVKMKIENGKLKISLRQSLLIL